jgi:hypothetical protein
MRGGFGWCVCCDVCSAPCLLEGMRARLVEWIERKYLLRLLLQFPSPAFASQSQIFRGVVVEG